MMQQLGHEVLAVYILNPFLTVPEFYEQLTTSLRLGLSSKASKPEILNTLALYLSQRHRRGLRTVLIADEAHGLSPTVLEEIRLLANLETNTEKLLQIVLCGQPELRETLNQPNLRQLKQRISLRCSIKPLTLSDVNKYIRFRLKIAGAERVDVFDAGAIDLIARVSLGIPRVINNICDNALLQGYALSREVITSDMIENVIETLDISTNDMTTNDNLDFGPWVTPKHLTAVDGSHN
jgi:general secretion pathway protein A